MVRACSSHLWLCWGVMVLGHVCCQTAKYAPQNVTVTADYESLHVTWVAPKESSKNLTAFRVQIFSLTSQPQPQPQPNKDHWVPKGSEHSHYTHTVTCLKPSREFHVKVLAVYPASQNVSEADALSDAKKIRTKSRTFLNDLFEHPIQIVVGAAMTILLLLLIVPATCFCLYKRRSRSRLLRVTTTGVETTQHRQNARRSPNTTILPSAKDLRRLENRDPQQQIPSATGATGATAGLQQSPAMAVATQQSRLLHYSPPSSYQSWCSVPSQIAPGRPSVRLAGKGARALQVGDDYELLQDGDVYENVLQAAALAKPRVPIVKSTSFSGMSSACRVAGGGGRGGRGAPPPINEGKDGGDDGDDGDDDGDDNDDYMNYSFERRCATMPNKNKKSRDKSTKAVVECIQEDSEIYGNC